MNNISIYFLAIQFFSDYCCFFIDVDYKRYQFLGTYLKPNDAFKVIKNRNCYGRIRHCVYDYYIEGACLAVSNQVMPVNL